MPKHFFTVDEARETLPFINRVMDAVFLLLGQLNKEKEQVKKFAEQGSLNAGGPEGTRYLQELALLRDQLASIEALGCIVKSVDEGLIDFPHMRDGREVYLCWKHGEADIRYWHEVDAGFAGRTPLD